MNRPSMPHYDRTRRPALPLRARPRPRTMLTGVALSLALALASCGWGDAGGDAAEPPPLAGAAIGGDFTLINSEGQTVRWADFAGQWRIVYFGYTFCPDVCPVDAQAIGQGLTLFAKEAPDRAEQVTPIFITIDPERDTAQAVGEFVANFHPRMVGLTGTEEQVAQAADAFVVYHEKGAESAGGGYLMEHSNAAMLFDPDGNPVALLPTNEGAAAVAEELAKWVR
ncbi:SCO family protein [uncultured Croceicoccus sp.]|uniref:SCO family protein n=1 Tax=uncultured Croceicoccus sp. TaxID=1295329 RepID=UPI002617659C|nr:SCO family protein [uncultured Croceicoccus sp.]